MNASIKGIQKMVVAHKKMQMGNLSEDAKEEYSLWFDKLTCKKGRQLREINIANASQVLALLDTKSSNYFSVNQLQFLSMLNTGLYLFFDNKEAQYLELKRRLCEKLEKRK